MVTNSSSKSRSVLFTETESIIQTCTLSFIMFSIIVGNIFVLVILQKNNKMRTPQYLLVANLAVGDTGVGFLCVPFTLITALYQGKWKLGEVACQYHAFAVATFFISTILTITTMTIEKYFSLVRPLSRFMTVKRTKYAMAAIWIISLIISVFPFLNFGRYGFNHSTLSCGIAYPDTTLEKLYLILPLVLGFIVPLTVMVFSFTRIFIAVLQHSRRIEQHTKGTSAGTDVIHLQKHLTITIILILVVFVVSWTPFFILVTLAQANSDVTELPSGLGVIAYWLGYFGSAWNPIIYVTRNRYFRDEAKLWLCFCLRKTSKRNNSVVTKRYERKYSRFKASSNFEEPIPRTERTAKFSGDFLQDKKTYYYSSV